MDQEALTLELNKIAELLTRLTDEVVKLRTACDLQQRFIDQLFKEAGFPVQ